MSRDERAAAEAKLGIVHRDGVRWNEAPLPRLLHRCTAHHGQHDWNDTSTPPKEIA